MELMELMELVELMELINPGRRMRGKQKRGMPASVYGVSSWGTEKVLKLVSGNGCTTLWIYKQRQSE